MNIYNVTKSVVSLEKLNHVEVKKAPEEVIFEKVKIRQVSPEAEAMPKSSAKEFIVPMAIESREKVQEPIEAPSKIVETEIPIEIDPKLSEAPLKPQRSFPEPSEGDRTVLGDSPKSFNETTKNETHSEVTTAEIPTFNDEQRATSPLWTYTLPAPPIFSDTSAATERQKNGVYSDFASTDCNETILSDSNTTVISAETHIQPIIVTRLKSLDDSFNIASPIPDDESDKSTEIITSDLEDGYLGNGKSFAVLPESPFKKEIVIEDFKRSRLIITRSDSFHSIGQGRHFDVSAKRGPLSPQRSTSFLSLVQAQKAERIADRSDSAPYSRQKSNSELSISDTPSLQSLEVIKNILNSSRKNSLDVVESTPAVVKKPEEIFVTRQVSEPIVEVKPVVETQWRYSGPPKINLGTWSERPKVEVAIAADSDYKFGKAAPRDFKNDAPVTTSKRHTIHISNERVEVPEKHLPKVLGVEYKKDASPAAEIVNRPTRTIINIKPRPMSMDVGNSYSTVTTSTGYNRNVTSPTSNTSVTFNRPATSPPTSPAAVSTVSYNRLTSNAKKFTPVVRGFKLNNIKEGADQPEFIAPPVVEKKLSAPPSVPAKPTFIRSTSSGDINRNARFSMFELKDEDSSTDFPFSQTTLRKTGLKDKFLLSDKDTKSIFGRVLDQHEQKPAQTRETNREEQVEKVAIRQMSMPPPPKPPAALPAMNFRKSAPLDSNSRNHLLEAIKNFNRDSLRNQ